jgi:hypothetical protein
MEVMAQREQEPRHDSFMKQRDRMTASELLIVKDSSS